MRTVDPDEAKEIRENLRFGYAGVGSDWYYESHWYSGLNQPALMTENFDFESLGPRTELGQVIVNIRGDRLTHAAAACGAGGLLTRLLQDFQIDINQLNAEGETPLLCACRSGHPDLVKIFLDNGARADIPARNGETPLHWLIAFGDTVNPVALGQDLINRGGAKVDAFTTQPVSHSLYPANIDVDFQ